MNPMSHLTSSNCPVTSYFSHR